MTALSHVLVTLTTSSFLGLHGKELVTAFVFGNLIDLDHFLLWKKEGVFELSVIDGRKKFRGRAHTFLHEPVFALPVAAISGMLMTTIPLLFWSLHVALDHLFLRSDKRPLYPVSKEWKTYGYFGLGSKIEWILDIVLVALLVWLWRR